MQITLNQDEINTAVEMYLHSQINIADDQQFSIDFTAGRGPNGLTAAIDIRAQQAPAALRPQTAPKAVKAVSAPTPAAEPEAEPEAPAEPEDEAETPAEEPGADGPGEETKGDSADTEEADQDDDGAATAASPRTSIFSAKKAS